MRMEIEEWIKHFYEVRPLMKAYNTPKKVVELMGGEVEEVGQEINLWHEGEPTEKQIKLLAHEIADVFIYGFYLASMFDIDVTDAILDKLALNHQRFPIDLFQLNGHSFESVYLTRKIELGER